MVHDMDEREQRVCRERPRFYAMLMALGDSDPKRAAALGVQRMTVARYRLGLATPQYLLNPGTAAGQSRARASIDPVILDNRRRLVRAFVEDATEPAMVAA